VRARLRPQGAGLYSLINQPEPVSAADVNFDSKITLTEFLAPRRIAISPRIDAAQAGFLTLSGLPQTPRAGDGRGPPPPPSSRLNMFQERVHP